MEFFKLSLLFAVLWGARGLQLLLPLPSHVPVMLSSPKVNCPRQMLTVRRVTTLWQEPKSPGLRSKSPSVCLFDSGTSLNTDQILLLPIVLLLALARRIWT